MSYLATCLLTSVLLATASAPDPGRLLELEPEQLMNIKVTSVSRTAEPLAASPAAVFALTREDIRRAGATSIPEALRLVPGVTVARIDANKWAISIRGENARFFNKLLVMVDGRVVYDPLHAGVYWDVQDTVLEDVDRIEVIRGPGATLWGSNAVTGVIHIITRSAQETMGQAESASAGTADRAILEFRDGHAHGKTGAWRVWGKLTDRDDTVRTDGTDGRDAWRQGRMGFRFDDAPRAGETLTVLGQVYAGRADQELALATFPPGSFRLDESGIPFRGGSAQVRWSRSGKDGAATSAHAYIDYTDRQEFSFEEQRTSYYGELQHTRPVGKRQQLLLGASHYLTTDRLHDAPELRVSPPTRDLPTTAIFAQDRIALDPGRWTLTVGARLEHAFYTGLNLQHTARLAFQPSAAHTVWAAASQAVRTPARIERDLATIASPPITLLHVNPELDGVEHLGAYELGWRAQASKRVSFDLAAFFNRSTNILAFNALPPAGLVVPFELISSGEGTARGFETYVACTASPSWTVTAGYSYLDLRFGVPDSSPRNQVQLRSQHQLGARTTLDATLYLVGSVQQGAVPGYDRLDLRCGRSVGRDETVSLVGQNLLDARHAEFGSVAAPLGRDEIRRSVHAQYTKGF